MPLPAPTISEVTLTQMELDASKAKAELHVANHVRALVAEVRLLSQRQEAKPTVEQANAALAIVTSKDTAPLELKETARKVLERFLS